MNKNYQDIILNHVRKDAMPCTIFLTSGFQIRGIVKAFDNYVLILEVDGRLQMIYKHAVSTVIPLRMPGSFNLGPGDE